MGKAAQRKQERRAIGRPLYLPMAEASVPRWSIPPLTPGIRLPDPNDRGGNSD